MSPLFELEKITLFADNYFIIWWNKCLKSLIAEIKRALESITNWLRQSRLKVNESKTEICLFHLKEHPPIEINVLETSLTTKNHMNVLVINFDSKLQWQTSFKMQSTKAKSTPCNIYYQQIFQQISTFGNDYPKLLLNTIL